MKKRMTTQNRQKSTAKIKKNQSIHVSIKKYLAFVLMMFISLLVDSKYV